MDSIFVDSPTERTTSVTDVILALLALGCCLLVLRMGRASRGRRVCGAARWRC